MSKSYNALDMVALEMANHVLLVTQLDLPCLRNVVRLMMSFGEMETVKDKIKILVNRVGLDNQISLKKAKDTIGREIFWQLPNDYRTMVEVRNNGVPLIEQAPKAAITQSIIALADALSGDPEPKRRPRPANRRIGKLAELSGRPASRPAEAGAGAAESVAAPATHRGSRPPPLAASSAPIAPATVSPTHPRPMFVRLACRFFAHVSFSPRRCEP